MYIIMQCRIKLGRGPGRKIDKQKKKKKRSSTNKRKETPLRPRERGALESAGPVAYATFATRLIRHCYYVPDIACRAAGTLLL